MLTFQVCNLKTDDNEANEALKNWQTNSIEQEEHNSKMDKATNSFSQVINKLMAE